MTWNYRVMEWERDGERWQTIHEVYYDEDGGLWGFISEPAHPLVTDDEEMADELDRFAEAMTKPTLVAEQFPSG